MTKRTEKTDNKARIIHSYAKEKTEQIRDMVKREMCSATEKANDTQVRLEYTGSPWDSINLGIGLAEMIGGAALTVFGAGGTVISFGSAGAVTIPAAGVGVVAVGLGLVTVHSALQNMFAIQVSHSSSSSTNSNDKSQTDKKESSGSGSNAGKNSGSTQGGGGTESKIQEASDVAHNYNLSENTFNNHILNRHGADSSNINKSHFNKNFDIKKGIDSILKGDNSIVKPNTAGREGYIFEQTFTDPIGTSTKGKMLYTLKVVIDETGNVITAFPK